MGNNTGTGWSVGTAIVASVALIFSVFGFVANKPADVSQLLAGQRAGLQEFIDGIKNGDVNEKGVSVTIAAGANQAAWLNNTGRTVYVSPASVSLRAESGTASSSLLFYAGTSTASTFSDYARPTPATLAIDGALVATSSPAGTAGIIVIGTTTSSGTGLAVASGSYFIFDIQEQFFCKSNGACETATSSNRGITTFTGQFKYTY